MTIKKTKKKSQRSPQAKPRAGSSPLRQPGSESRPTEGRLGKKSVGKNAKKKKGAISSPRAERERERSQSRGANRSRAAAGAAFSASSGNPPTQNHGATKPVTTEASQQASKSAEARARRASAKYDSARAPTLGVPPKRRPASEPLSGPTLPQDMSHDEPQSAPPPEPSHSSGEESTESLPIGGVDVDMLGIGSPVFLPGHSEMDDATEDWHPEGEWADDVSVETRIREIQERLDGLMGPEPSGSLDPVRPPAPEEQNESTQESAVTSAREVLESEYYRRNWGRGAIRERTFDVDDFGLDPDFERKVRPVVDFLFKRYFRVEVEGVRHVPEHGRGVVVANHSGALPFDGVMLRHAITTRHSSRDDLRWLAEDFSFYLPFLGVAVNRMGAVRACPENATRLLEREHLVGVFPEGVQGMKKLYKDRYRLRRFGRGGFVRLALQTQSPIIPCAIVGAEETHPIFFRFDNLSTILGLDYLPVTPTFPWLGPLGLIPAPTKWRILFGEPISVEGYGPAAAYDHVLVGRLTEQVRQTISGMLQTALRRRRSIWFG